MLVKNTSTFSTDISAQGYDGLIGLGPNSGSLIMDELDEDGTGGDAVLDRIFQLNQTSQNYITFMLDRKNDPLSTATGQFTIGEPVKGFENITSAPKLDVIKVPGLTDRDQHWQMYTDVDGVIGPDGQPIKVDSIVPKAPDGQLVAVIDSGFTLPQVSTAVEVSCTCFDPTYRFLELCRTQYMVVFKVQAGMLLTKCGQSHVRKC